MKNLWIGVGVLVVALVAFLGYARTFGFNPGKTSPGLWLSGEVSEWPDRWDAVSLGGGGAQDASVRTAVETRQWFASWLPHSVTTGYFPTDGKMYVASGYPAGITLPNGRHWNRNLLANPYMRIRVAGKLYEGRATYLEDGPERQAVLRQYGPIFFSPGFYLHVWRVDPLT